MTSPINDSKTPIHPPGEIPSLKHQDSLILDLPLEIIGEYLSPLSIAKLSLTCNFARKYTPYFEANFKAQFKNDVQKFFAFAEMQGADNGDKLKTDIDEHIDKLTMVNIYQKLDSIRKLLVKTNIDDETLIEAFRRVSTIQKHLHKQFREELQTLFSIIEIEKDLQTDTDKFIKIKKVFETNADKYHPVKSEINTVIDGLTLLNSHFKVNKINGLLLQFLLSLNDEKERILRFNIKNFSFCLVENGFLDIFLNGKMIFYSGAWGIGRTRELSVLEISQGLRKYLAMQINLRPGYTEDVERSKLINQNFYNSLADQSRIEEAVEVAKKIPTEEIRSGWFANLAIKFAQIKQYDQAREIAEMIPIGSCRDSTSLSISQLIASHPIYQLVIKSARHNQIKARKLVKKTFIEE